MLARAPLSLACALGVYALLGCAAPPGAQPIVGPTGQPMAHVHCGGNQGQCFRIAGELCPQGYDIQPVLSGADGNFLVRCHAAAVGAAPAVISTPSAIPPGASAPSVLAAAPARTGHDGPREQPAPQAWPPAAEPSPAPNPWADRDKDVTAGANSKPVQIDLGY